MAERRLLPTEDPARTSLDRREQALVIEAADEEDDPLEAALAEAADRPRCVLFPLVGDDDGHCLGPAVDREPALVDDLDQLAPTQLAGDSRP